MNIYKEGDIYGRNRIGEARFKRHYRPTHHDISTHVLYRNGVLDDVGADVGESVRPSNFCDFQLPSSQNRKEEK
jgi:hypothetical protein